MMYLAKKIIEKSEYHSAMGWKRVLSRKAGFADEPYAKEIAGAVMRTYDKNSSHGSNKTCVGQRSFFGNNLKLGV